MPPFENRFAADAPVYVHACSKVLFVVYLFVCFVVVIVLQFWDGINLGCHLYR